MTSPKLLRLVWSKRTVKRAVAQAARTGVRFLTIHASGAVMRAAVEGRGDSSLQLLAVTVLTSFDRQDLAELGYDCEVSSLVNLLAPRAMQAGGGGGGNHPPRAGFRRAPGWSGA